MKRIMCCIIVLVLIVSSVQVFASAAEIDITETATGASNCSIIDYSIDNNRLSVTWAQMKSAVSYSVKVATGTNGSSHSAWQTYKSNFRPNYIAKQSNYYVYGYESELTDTTLNNMKMPVSSSTRPNRLRSLYVFVCITALNSKGKEIGSSTKHLSYDYCDFAPYFASSRQGVEVYYATRTIPLTINMPQNMSRNARYVRLYYATSNNKHVKWADYPLNGHRYALTVNIPLYRVLYTTSAKRCAYFTVRMMDANHKACSPYISLSYGGCSRIGGNRNLIYLQQN